MMANAMVVMTLAASRGGPYAASGRISYSRATPPIRRALTLMQALDEEAPPVWASWRETPSGYKFIDEEVGTGVEPARYDVVAVHYTVSLAASGTELGKSWGRWPLTFALGRHDVPIWDEALTGMRVGGKRRVVVPYSRIPSSQAANVPVDQEGEDLRLDLSLIGLETGAAAVLPSLLPPGNRRVTVARFIFALSFIPYFLPPDIKPDAYKVRDIQEVRVQREAAQNARFLGGDVGTSLDSLFPPP